jgi:ubiquinone/menaquinone biosynthesis C-methylase UbiE
MRERANATGSLDYHAQELRIARDPADRRRIMPVVARGRRVLEVGCGAGQIVGTCEAPAGALRCGIDVDGDALGLGRQLVPGVRFVQAAGEALPFRAGTFDFVIARVVLPYLDLGPALADIARVLGSGGTLWAVLHPLSMAWSDLVRSARARAWKAALFRSYVLVNGAWLHLTGRVVRVPLSGRIESFQTSRGIRRALRRAGLEPVEVARDRFFVVTARKP